MKKSRGGRAHHAINTGMRETKTRTYLMAYSLTTWCIHDGAIPLGAWC